MANSSLVQMKESILGKKRQRRGAESCMCTCDSTKYACKIVSGDFCTVYGTNIFPPLALVFGRRISVTEGVKNTFFKLCIPRTRLNYLSLDLQALTN